MGAEMKIGLLGAGHIGRAIARLLGTTGNYQVVAIDQSEAALDILQKESGASIARVQGGDEASLREALQGCETIVNALPWQFAQSAAQTARAMNAHYFDLTEDVAATEAIKAIAHGAQTLFMPQCGLAPGFVGLVARDLAGRFESVESLKLRVGALPQFPDNALKYNITWSVDGLVNEYLRPCPAVRHGQKIDLQPLEGLETLAVDGVEYEAFNTSGGLGDIAEGLAGMAQSIDYKTMRYPGHCEKMRFLIHDLRLGENPDALKAILLNAVPSTEQDVVVVSVSATGVKDGVFRKEVFARKIKAQSVAGVPMTAIQLTTAGSICVAVDLLREGKLAGAGFASQSRVPLDDFLGNFFGQLIFAGDSSR